MDIFVMAVTAILVVGIPVVWWVKNRLAELERELRDEMAELWGR